MPNQIEKMNFYSRPKFKSNSGDKGKSKVKDAKKERKAIRAALKDEER
jgi:hypothetical protein